jgi:hypothetical protein
MLADKEAKNSLSLKNIYIFDPLYKEDIKTLSRTILKDMWQKKMGQHPKRKTFIWYSYLVMQKYRIYHK